MNASPPKGRSILVVEDEIAMLERCEEEGEWLHKPFRMERLASVVQTALGQAAG